MYRFFKRAFCIIASAIGIIVTSPIWLFAMVGIKISDPGPVFYIARRIGKNNREFKMFKFRTMRVDQDADEQSFKADTNRIFPFGAFLRASKIDELPQLLNCLIGDMAIIGPRPASKDQVSIVRAGRYSVVSTVTPGLSGPSALYDYIYGDTIEDAAEYKKLVLPTRLELDRYYVSWMSATYDIKMIWWTVLCILCSFSHSESKTTNRILVELKSYMVEEDWKIEEFVVNKGSKGINC
jgi:lipopolysaccharide/colanic/teichoic acid biosynthesis glycosyltransferase